MNVKVLNLGKIPIKSWADEMDEGALNQAKNLSNLDFAYKHIALMADVHSGFGMPIGGVLASDDIIIPNAVGVDIGCGIIGAKTDLIHISQKEIKSIVDKSHKKIPLGFKSHKKQEYWEGFERAPEYKVVQTELEPSKYQLGTLGGGNHFMTIEKGSDGHIWMMVHSGSRNFGYKVANYYNKIAKKINKKTKLVPEKTDLAGLHIDSKEGKEYFNAMNYSLEYAAANREELFRLFYDIFVKETGSKEILKKINVHHNYASIEEHFKKQVIIHRKGAIRAEKGELGIIPGSMGTPSYIVEGLGSKESFKSCSHGAGRALSRRQANKEFTKEMVDKSMKGIVFKGWKKDFSEAPMAYKDIEDVMESQEDLVKPVVKLSPLGVVKG